MPLDISGSVISKAVATGLRYKDIVTRGLIVHLDASAIDSYPQTGTTWYDISTNTNNGTLNNGPTFNSANNGSIVLDGTDDDISFGNILSINTFTLSLWVYPGATQTTYADILDNNHRGGTSFVCQQNVNATNQYGFSVGDGGAGSDVGLFTLTANQWTHLTFTFNSQAKGYTNGSLFGTGASIANPYYTGIETFRLGEWGGGGRNWNGRYGNFMAYNRALAASEVLQNYNVQKSRFGL
jgi:hypothetical protein